jgi:hypothetical protein
VTPSHVLSLSGKSYANSEQTKIKRTRDHLEELLVQQLSGFTFVLTERASARIDVLVKSLNAVHANERCRDLLVLGGEMNSDSR